MNLARIGRTRAPALHRPARPLRTAVTLSRRVLAVSASYTTPLGYVVQPEDKVEGMTAFLDKLK